MTAALLAAALLAGSLAPARAENPSPAVRRAMDAGDAGDAQGARAAIAEALKEKPSLEDRQRLASVHQKLKDWKRAEAALRELVKESPERPGLRTHLACVLALKGDRAAALAELGRAAALKPGATERQRIAFLHADLKDWAPARGLLDALIAEKPEDASLRLDRAAVLLRTGPRALGLEDLAVAARSKAPEERLRAARLLGDFGELERARTTLSALADASPRDPAPLLASAELSAGAGDEKAARAALEKALAREPDDDALRRAAEAYRRLKDYGAAAGVARRAMARAPKAVTPRLELAAAAARAGGRSEALDALTEAAALGPDLQERQRMALLYQDLGERERARALLAALIAEQPGDPQLRLNLAFFEADAGDAKAARAALAKARELALDPDDSKRAAALEERLASAGTPPSGPALVKEREALRLAAAGEHVRAAALLDALLAESPGEPRLLLERAAAAARAGRLDEALRTLAGVTPPRAGWDQRRRAALLRQELGDPGALAAFEALSKERPDDASLLADLGLSRWLAGRTDPAIAALKTAIAKDPRALAAYLTLGSIYAAKGRFADELALYASAPADGGEPALRELLARSRASAEAKISR